MELVFMTGGLVISVLYTLIQFTIILTLAYFVYKIYRNYESSKKSKTPIRKTIEKSHFYFIGIGVLFFFLTAVNPAVMPKREISTVQTRPQIEYNRGVEVEIVRPPERTERLDGFRPLKERE